MVSDIIPSLAILMVDWDEKEKDYLQNFVPMVAECIRRSPNDVVALPDLEERFSERFGFKLPLKVMERILRRAARQNYLEFDNTLKAYRPNRKRLNKLGFAEFQRDTVKKYEHLVVRSVRVQRQFPAQVQ